HNLQLKIALPLLGRLLSKSREAYKHLSDSVQHFTTPQELAQLCESVGFHLEAIRPLTYGAATLLLLRKRK
ncbi:MAG: class I SAM-dependent methyltransferase, partial [Verrucomicrobia bacterium]|nr:class I SAM-dependent methyltransferase [Verrucomicrobiota bacterium]